MSVSSVANDEEQMHPAAAEQEQQQAPARTRTFNPVVLELSNRLMNAPRRSNTYTVDDADQDGDRLKNGYCISSPPKTAKKPPLNKPAQNSPTVDTKQSTSSSKSADGECAIASPDVDAYANMEVRPANRLVSKPKKPSWPRAGRRPSRRPNNDVYECPGVGATADDLYSELQNSAEYVLPPGAGPSTEVSPWFVYHAIYWGNCLGYRWVTVDDRRRE